MAGASGDRVLMSILLYAVLSAEDRILQRINQLEAKMLAEVQGVTDMVTNLETVTGQVQQKVNQMAAQPTISQEDRDALVSAAGRIQNVVGELQAIVG